MPFERTSHPFISSLPMEIKTFLQAKQYMNDLKEGAVSTYCSKLMLVGSPGVGKTSIAFAFQPLYARFKPESTVLLMGPNLIVQRGDELIRLLLNRSCYFQRTKNALVLRSLSMSDNFIRLEYESSIDEAPPTLLYPNAGEVNIELHFDGDDQACDLWHQYIAHWTSNTATRGIALSTRYYKQDNKPPLEMRVMDFAGQDEYVPIFDGLSCPYNLFIDLLQIFFNTAALSERKNRLLGLKDLSSICFHLL
jgi:GTPase SAR1 family protein